MFSKLSTLAMAGAASLAAFSASAQPQLGQTPPAQQGLTQTCAFSDGPRAGQTVDYGGSPGAVPVRVGSRCADMRGSSGQAVAAPVGREGGGREGLGRFYASPGAPTPGAPTSGVLGPGYTQTCSFNSGPRAGTRSDFSRTLGAQPVAVGSACSDGPNKGVAVAAGQPAVPGR